MPFKRIERLTNDSGAELGIRIYGISPRNAPDRGFVQVLYEDIVGGPWTAGRLERFRKEFQDKLDYRTLRSSWPADEENIQADPARNSVFWDGADLVVRAVQITRISWTGTQMDFAIGVVGD